MNYALYEALRIVVEEGLEARFRRHRANASALQSRGSRRMGLSLAAQEGLRLAATHRCHGASRIEEAKVRAQLLEKFNVEIGAGLGPLKGKVWRIGLDGRVVASART